MNPTLLIQGIYPYIIHADPPWDEAFPYPTHTHGLYDIGLPEFIMDPLAFGGEGNAQSINAAYRYLIDPKNLGQLDAILNGRVIKLTCKELNPKYMYKDPYVYCLNEVFARFEAVKQAYGSAVMDYFPKMRFIQIWVEGDEYALTDEYYRGGVKW